MKDKKKKYRKGYFIAIGISIGIIFGTVLAVSLNNMGLIGHGFLIGLAVGVALEGKHKKEAQIHSLAKDK